MFPHVACRYRSAFLWRATNTSTHAHRQSHCSVAVPWAGTQVTDSSACISSWVCAVFCVCGLLSHVEACVLLSPLFLFPFLFSWPPSLLWLPCGHTHTHTPSQTSTHTHLCPLLDSASSQDCSTGTLHSLSCGRRGEEGLGWGGQRFGWCPPQLFTSRQTSERMKVCAAGSRRGKTNPCRGKRDWRVDAACLSKYSHKNVWLPKNYFFLFWWTNKIMASIYK